MRGIIYSSLMRRMLLHETKVPLIVMSGRNTATEVKPPVDCRRSRVLSVSDMEGAVSEARRVRRRKFKRDSDTGIEDEQLQFCFGLFFAANLPWAEELPSLVAHLDERDEVPNDKSLLD